jgi:hypothetical protein
MGRWLKVDSLGNYIAQAGLSNHGGTPALCFHSAAGVLEPKAWPSRHRYMLCPNEMQTKQPNTDTEVRSSPTSGHPWAPRFSTGVPWLSILSIIVVIACAAASAAVLLRSHEQPTATWSLANQPIQPTVILAILTVLSNALLRHEQGQAGLWTGNPRRVSSARVHGVQHLLDWTSGYDVCLRKYSLREGRLSLLELPIISSNTHLFGEGSKW